MKQTLNDLLSAKGDKSSTRFVLLLLTYTVMFVLLITALSAIWGMIHGKKVDWSGISDFILALVAMESLALGGKVWQKNIESKNGIDTD